MNSFASWQARAAEYSATNKRDTVLFLAYEAASASEASAAGFELMGTTWDANGVEVKAYKAKPPGVPEFGCVICGKNSQYYHGVYCCGRKRVLML
ncbi:hypothetical protein IFT74_16215 [Oxalobacteraceae sp. CFBP 8755]|jgi:hypothetical protein|nr:hypothetical protein [Oxalobacteraceae sp. CFBP 8755]MBD8722133.1 hypothetical protein [Oxalobacteraceae sp. CFBP 13708]